jgi:hypothetical protein
MCNSVAFAQVHGSTFDQAADSFRARGNVGLAAAPLIDATEEVVVDAHDKAMITTPRHALGINGYHLATKCNCSHNRNKRHSTLGGPNRLKMEQGEACV